jgi:hypothetical protein
MFAESVGIMRKVWWWVTLKVRWIKVEVSR